MIVLFDFCTIPWWLTWILPFLLGLGIGWLVWGRFKALLEEAESKISVLNTNIGSLETSLDACKKVKIEAEGNVALLKGRMREMEASVQLGAVPLAGITVASASATSLVDKYYTAIGDSNFQIIEGIGPKMEEILKENNINNFATLSSISKDDLKSILSKYGEKYRIIDPNTWPQQAGLASDRRWNELIDLQKALDTGRSDTIVGGTTDSKLEKYLIKTGIIRRWSQDDLKTIEGIGPKIEELLHTNGIKTWRALAETAVTTIQEILTEAGSRFSLADPTTWPKQAEMAADGKWDELQEYQDFLQAGKGK